MASEITGCLLFLSYCVSALAVEQCTPHTLAQYKVSFQGLWTKERFPKVYPDLRPKAEWTSMIGRSHSSLYSLFSLGELVSNNLQSFVEYGDSSKLNNEGQGHPLILDSFTSQSLHSGHGMIESQFFSDSERYKVSFAAKIVPSPDWFVGVDSYSLCQNGKWISGAELDLFPLDAGSQQGYTFSSPRWRSDPQESIHEITNIYPNRTADAFYYPQWNSLPPIARVNFSLLQVYRADETLKLSADGATLSTQDRPAQLNEWSSTAEAKKPTQPPVSSTTRQTLSVFKPNLLSTSTARPSTPGRTTALMKTMKLMFSARFQQEAFTTSSEVTLNRKIQDILDQIRETRKRTTLAGALADNTKDSAGELASSTALPKTSVYAVHLTTDIFDDDEDINDRREGSGLDVEENLFNSDEEEITSTEGYQSNRILPPDSMFDEKACLVTSWTEWSDCSRTCGYGTKSRRREIIKWTGNVACPDLTMEQLCGSMKKCNWNHFSLKFNSSKSIFGNQKRVRQKKVKLEDKLANITGALTGTSGSFRRRFKAKKMS